MRKVFNRGSLARAASLAAVGLAGLAVAATASSASQTIQVGSLVIVSGTATGTISGFQPNGSVSVNGGTYATDGSGTVALTAAPLNGSSGLSVGFVDTGGTARTVTAPLNDLTSGTPLSLAELSDPLPSPTAPSTLTVETGSGTTTVASGGTTTTSSTTVGGATTTGGGTTTVVATTTVGGTTTVVGGSSGGSMAGAIRLADGSTSIPASSVHSPYRLVIKQVVFKPTLVRSKKLPITVRFRVLDTRSMVVRNAAVWMRTLPLQVVTSVKTKRTSMTGWVTFTVRPMQRLKLQKGGRVNFFVRASTPGEPLIGGTSTRRLISLRTSTAR